MAVNTRTDLVPLGYQVGTPPDDQRSRFTWTVDQLRNISDSLRRTQEASIQVADVPPANPRRGTTRVAIMPWNPLGTAQASVVWFNGTAWVAL